MSIKEVMSNTPLEVRDEWKKRFKKVGSTSNLNMKELKWFWDYFNEKCGFICREYGSCRTELTMVYNLSKEYTIKWSKTT